MVEDEHDLPINAKAGYYEGSDWIGSGACMMLARTSSHDKFAALHWFSCHVTDPIQCEQFSFL